MVEDMTFWMLIGSEHEFSFVSFQIFDGTMSGSVPNGFEYVKWFASKEERD